jgi:predicted fused transcriptional regulator/phosphomethylpyrimidine kinase
MIIKKDGKVFCVTSVAYPAEVVKQMKKAGYKVKEV